MADPVDLEAFRKRGGPPPTPPEDEIPQSHTYTFNLKNGTTYTKAGVLFVTGNFVMLMAKSGTPMYLAPVDSLIDVHAELSPEVEVETEVSSDLIGVSFIEGLDDEE